MKAKTGKILLSLTVISVFFTGCLYFGSPIDDPDQGYDTEDYYDTGNNGEPCDSAEESTFRCEGDMLEYCSNGYWQEWEDCADSGETCWIETDSSWGECQGGGGGTTEYACPDGYGYCYMCYPDPPTSVDDLTSADLGCCGSNGNAYWGEDTTLVEDSCSNGCCAIYDDYYTMLGHECCS